MPGEALALETILVVNDARLNMDDQLQQKQDEEERMQVTLSVLSEASSRPLTLEERSFLAAELGLWREWMNHTCKRKVA